MTRLYIRRRPQSWAGELIGILTLETAIPYVRGNVSNATTYNFPVRYKTIPDASIDRVLNRSDRSLIKAVIAAAQELESDGVRAITGACGFMALFQREVADALKIPVFLSSLLQIPMLYATTRRPIGIITADDRRLGKAHFAACDIPPSLPVIVYGMQNQPEFRSAILDESGSLDSSLIEAEAVSVAMRMTADHPEIGAILLECSDLPPYARAIQDSTGCPVFDYVTMINWAAYGLRQTNRAWSE